MLYQSFCCLFFIQAIVATFPDAVVYAEFPEIWGFGYRTIQAKRSSLLSDSCLIGVTAHGSFEWLHEVNSRYRTEQTHWRSQAYHYEQFSYENADVTYSPSHFLKSKLANYGWKTAHAKHLPYFVPKSPHPPTPSPKAETRGAEQLFSPLPKLGEGNTRGEGIPVIFFGRLEERKGLCTFLEALKLLDSAVVNKIDLTFIGKIIPLQSSHLEHLNSQQYIDRELGNAFTYTLLSDLSSQEAMQAIADRHYPIVCLTSLQENFPNAALELGQLPVSLVVSDTGGFRESLDLLHRTDSLHWFQPGNAHASAQALTQAIHAYPENPTTIEQAAVDQINHHLLSQRLEFMSQAFLEAAPKKPTTPSVTIALVCWHSATTLLECLTSLAAQTYEQFDVIVWSPVAADESMQAAIARPQTQFPQHKYLTAAPSSLGETYNHLVDQSTGEYFLLFSPDQIATPDLIEKMVVAAIAADAVAVVCPQMIAAGETPEAITLIDVNLLKLLEFNHRHDLTALFSKAFLKKFRYAQERGLQALNWQIFAAAIATDQAIAYYPYPLYSIHPNAPSTIPPANFAKERYYLRQFLFQIKPEQWNQRQINLLVTGFEQLTQVQSQRQPSSRQDQAWMMTAQQMHSELTQAQAAVEHLQRWNRELQTGKDWLESQWQAWMLRTQKAEVAWERSRSLLLEMQGSKFWKLRQAWIKIKRKLGKMSADPLQPAAHTFTPGVQEFVARIAGQKVRFFQSAATQAPVVSIISSCFQEYQYIETSYRSIINQTLQNFEWIIVDDGATDPETKALLASLPQRTAKIRVLSHASSHGVAASYNTAIAQAKGKHLCFVDFGGILDPTYLEKCVLFLETHPQIAVINSYSIVFQAQEHWWHSHLNQPISLFNQNGTMSHPTYRKTEFNQLGGFDETLHGFAAWERCLKALAHHQSGWTIPEYLDCYRATDETTPAIAHNFTSDVQQTIETIHDRHQTVLKLPTAIVEPQSLNLSTLNVRLNIENQLERFNAGKRLLLFCDALDNSDVAKIAVINSYSIVFQAQEHWWHSHLNQPISLFNQNGTMSHPTYRKTEFNQLGGFDETLHGFAAWERCLKALAHHQSGWTIPEYLDCYRATDETTPAIAHNFTSDVQQTIETIHDRHQTVLKLPTAIVEPQSLNLSTLNVRLNIENQLERFNAGKRLLLFCDALDNSDVAKWNCDLVIWLVQCGYDVTIVTTSTSDHACQEFFYRATPDIFHLPNLFDQAHWLAFIRYILAARQIDGVLISGSEIAYAFLSLMRVEFPQIALMDYIHAGSAIAQNNEFSPTHSLSQSLDYRLVASHRRATESASSRATLHTKTKVCSTQADVEVALAEAIKARQTFAPTKTNIESEEALGLLLEDLQEPIAEHKTCEEITDDLL